MRTEKIRGAVQLLAAVGLNSWAVKLREFCFPVLNCHSCPLAVFACPIGVLINFNVLNLFPFITVGILALAGILLGRFWCGWLCPFGWLQELLHKLKVKKLQLDPRWRYAKYVILLVFVFLIPFFFPELPAHFCYLCPAATLESSLYWRLAGYTGGSQLGFGVRIVILAFFLLLALVASRGFCRTACPLGALLGLFNRFSLFRLRRDPAGRELNLTPAICPVAIDPVRQMNDPECVRCLKCALPGGTIKAGV